MKARTLPLLLLAAGVVGSCSPRPLPLTVLSRDGSVTFTTELKWRYFVVPYRPDGQIERVEVWSGDRWLWRVHAQAGRMIELPVRYGQLPTGADQITAPQPLQRGKNYRLEVGTFAAINAFRIDRSGEVRGLWLPYEPDPDLIGEERRKRQRVPELMRTGLSRAKAEAAFAEEQRLGVRY